MVAKGSALDARTEGTVGGAKRPPLSNRVGVTHPRTLPEAEFKLAVMGVDAVTITVSPAHFERWLRVVRQQVAQWGADLAIGAPKRNRQYADVRQIRAVYTQEGGGELLSNVHVRRSPTGDVCAAVGPEGVNIEAKGPSSYALGLWLLASHEDSEPTSCSRLDVAFDFENPNEWIGDDVAQHLGWKRGEWFPIGASAYWPTWKKRGVPRSDRSVVNVYRTDLVEGREVMEPTLRVEVRAGRDLAPVWWRRWSEGEDVVLLGAGEVERRCRLDVGLAGAVPACATLKRERSEAARALLNLGRKNRMALELMAAHDVSAAEVLELARLPEARQGAAARKRAQRERELREEVERWDRASLREAMENERAREKAARGERRNAAEFRPGRAGDAEAGARTRGAGASRAGEHCTRPDCALCRRSRR